MSGQAVRQQFMRKFGGLSKHAQMTAIVIVASYIGQIVAAIGVGFWLLASPVTTAGACVIAAAIVFIATRLRGLNNIVHECSHHTFSEVRSDNVFYGSLCASLVLSCYQDYRDEHMTHHMHLGDYDKDMDLHGIRDLRLEDDLTPKTVLRHILTPLVGLHLPYYLGVNLSARDGVGFRYFKIGLILAAVGMLAVNPMSTILMIWLPFIWVYSALNYWTDCMDHGGLLETGDELEASRNMLVPMPLRAILFPRNDCFHLVHHLFPQVPAKHFEDCHNQLLTHPDYWARMNAKKEAGMLAEAELS